MLGGYGTDIYKASSHEEAEAKIQMSLAIQNPELPEHFIIEIDPSYAWPFISRLKQQLPRWDRHLRGDCRLHI